MMMTSLAPAKLFSGIKIKVYLISKFGECSLFRHVAMTFVQIPVTLQGLYFHVLLNNSLSSQFLMG